MDRAWKKISPWFHIIALIFTAGMAWGGVTAHGEKIAKLEMDQEELARIVIDLRISNARIEQGVKDIKSALNIKHREE